MKLKFHFSQAAFLLLAGFVHGQGFIYDQQSSTNELFVGGGGIIQNASPTGQSFTPTLSAVGFIRLSLFDWNPNNSLGAVMYLNLRSNSVSGTVLSTTPVISFGDSFSGFANFYFPSNVPIAAGVVYAFDMVMQSGSDSWSATASEYNYTGGTIFFHGAPVGGMSDLWFREGIVVVPEPSSALLALLGSVVWLAVHPQRSFVLKKQATGVK